MASGRPAVRSMLLLSEEHQHAVAGALHIRLNAVGAHLLAQIEGREGVFRRVAGGAPMGVIDQLHCQNLLYHPSAPRGPDSISIAIPLAKRQIVRYNGPIT